MRQKIKIIIKLIISLLLLYYIISLIDIRQIQIILKNVNIIFLSSTILLMLFGVLISSVKLYIILKPLKKINVYNLFIYYIIGTFYNLFMPSSIGGDTIKGIYMSRNEKIDLLISYSAIFIDRLTGAISLLAIAIFFSVYLLYENIYLSILSVGTCICIVYILLYLMKRLYWKYNKFLPNIILIFFDKIGTFFKISTNSNQDIIYIFLLSIIFQIISVLCNFLIAKALNIEISFISLLIYIPIISILSMIPISINGYGLQDVLYIRFFAREMIASNAMLISLVFHMCRILIGFIGCIFYCITPIKRE